MFENLILGLLAVAKATIARSFVERIENQHVILDDANHCARRTRERTPRNRHTAFERNGQFFFSRASRTFNPLAHRSCSALSTLFRFQDERALSRECCCSYALRRCSLLRSAHRPQCRNSFSAAVFYKKTQNHAHNKDCLVCSCFAMSRSRHIDFEVSSNQFADSDAPANCKSCARERASAKFKRVRAHSAPSHAHTRARATDIDPRFEFDAPKYCSFKNEPSRCVGGHARQLFVRPADWRAFLCAQTLAERPGRRKRARRRPAYARTHSHTLALRAGNATTGTGFCVASE